MKYQEQSQAAKRQVSIVVPAFNEAENLAMLHREIRDVCDREDYEWELIIVDDGSRDHTAAVVRDLPGVVYIRFRRNFGQTPALDAGIKQARYPYVVTMDGDGQNDPADIPRLLEQLDGRGLDVVSGWRRKRRDPLGKRIASRAAHALRRMLISDGIHDSGCTLKAYRAECFRGIHLYGEMHRFIPAVLKIKGFSIGEIEVNHRPRRAGRTNYSWKRGIKGGIDMISVWFWNKYAVRPLHLLGGLGVLSFLLGLVVSAVGIYLYIIGDPTFKNVLPVLAVFLFLTAVQLFVFGLIADMLAKQYFATSGDRSYAVAEVRHIEKGAAAGSGTASAQRPTSHGAGEGEPPRHGS
ncbi:MAG: glycosyltransferase family 2 protein [Spirochaetaceae bacterium]